MDGPSQQLSMGEGLHLVHNHGKIKQFAHALMSSGVKR